MVVVTYSVVLMVMVGWKGGKWPPRSGWWGGSGPGARDTSASAATPGSAGRPLVQVRVVSLVDDLRATHGHRRACNGPLARTQTLNSRHCSLLHALHASLAHSRLVFCLPRSSPGTELRALHQNGALAQGAWSTCGRVGARPTGEGHAHQINSSQSTAVTLNTNHTLGR